MIFTDVKIKYILTLIFFFRNGCPIQGNKKKTKWYSKLLPLLYKLDPQIYKTKVKCTFKCVYETNSLTPMSFMEKKISD